ncbi:unnamed protein product [Nezara viridula]|uniref:Uncharacterized protein n=1 Tax=Nezara viridula TaxID=85310 RepID=A0A9P0ML16_NEZVI|nr:unnamed protein product [Nezara viridula]
MNSTAGRSWNKALFTRQDAIIMCSPWRPGLWRHEIKYRECWSDAKLSAEVLPLVIPIDTTSNNRAAS